MEALGNFVFKIDGKSRLFIPSDYTINEEKLYMYNDQKGIINCFEGDEQATEELLERKKTNTFDFCHQNPLISQKICKSKRILIPKQISKERDLRNQSMIILGENKKFLLLDEERFLTLPNVQNCDIISSGQRLLIRPNDEKIGLISSNQALEVSKMKVDSKGRVPVKSQKSFENKTKIYCLFAQTGLRLFKNYLDVEQLLNGNKEQICYVFTLYIDGSGRIIIPEGIRPYLMDNQTTAIIKDEFGALITNPLYYTNKEHILSDDVLERQIEAEHKLIKKA